MTHSDRAHFSEWADETTPCIACKTGDAPPGEQQCEFCRRVDRLINDEPPK